MLKSKVKPTAAWFVVKNGVPLLWTCRGTKELAMQSVVDAANREEPGRYSWETLKAWFDYATCKLTISEPVR